MGYSIDHEKSSLIQEKWNWLVLGIFQGMLERQRVKCPSFWLSWYASKQPTIFSHFEKTPRNLHFSFRNLVLFQDLRGISTYFNFLHAKLKSVVGRSLKTSNALDSVSLLPLFCWIQSQLKWNRHCGWPFIFIRTINGMTWGSSFYSWIPFLSPTLLIYLGLGRALGGNIPDAKLQLLGS